VDALTRLAYSARAGDHDALEAFVRTGYEQVWRLCATLVDQHSSDDLAQETFLRAVRALPGFRGDSSARTWLLAIARHTCLDELRSRSRRRRRDALLRATTSSDEPTTPDASQSVAIADLLARLEPERRAAFVLTQSLGLSYDEAAQVCECPPGTIRSRVARARTDLLSLLADAGRDRKDSFRDRTTSG
jgi:RNA polymerase sigma-70 factor (ECF subfamily)